MRKPAGKKAATEVSVVGKPISIKELGEILAHMKKAMDEGLSFSKAAAIEIAKIIKR